MVVTEGFVLKWWRVFGFVGLSLSLSAAAGPELMNAGTKAEREHAATLGNLRNTCWNAAEPPRTSHELHCCSVFNQLSPLTLALSIHLCAWHDICIAKPQIWCVRFLVQRLDQGVWEQPASERSVFENDFQISRAAYDQILPQNTKKKKCSRRARRVRQIILLRHVGFSPEAPCWLTSSCVHHMPFTASCSLRCGSELPRVSALTSWREVEEPCRVAEANDELHREW